MASMSIVADMTTISITEETQTELRKIKGQLMASNGKERSFDDVIMELIKHWKIRRPVHEC
jgi:predicted CopG family antitoxin